MSDAVKIGVIGGSGLYNMPEITDRETRTLTTPFGDPSGPITIGTLRGKRVAFIPRHGIGHIYPPEKVPYRANVFAMKMLGVRFLISVNACGSLREDYAPGHVVIPDQIFDYTIGQRDRTFFDQSIVVHASVADPFDNKLSEWLADGVEAAKGAVHRSGTFLIEDGPRFATRAESHVFRQWGCDIIGMTTAPEAFLAREAEMAYASMAHITDYDVWHDEPVTVDIVMKTFKQNINLVQQALASAVGFIDPNESVPAHTALDGAIITAPEHINIAERDRLRPLLSRALQLDPSDR